EQDACMPFLREQVRLVSPKLIICLGLVAAKKLIDPDIRMGADHGVFVEKGGLLMAATYHPAAILRNPKLRADALEDFALVAKKAAGLGIPGVRDPFA
ncbi:MAG: uracil-DNA glycosylase, partial [Clostridia bacterium]|nr:uracil-DNA glycosylase [Clostridia bacterium]